MSNVYTIRSIFISLLILCLSTGLIKAQSAFSSKIVFLSDTSSNFNNLIGKFKGKMIYVDIWATWCAPCRKELQSKKDVKAFKEFALKNNIVVMYICCDKNGNSWKRFITANNLIGYHTLINKYINQDFHTTFSTLQNRNGVMKRSFYMPRHMIIDQFGGVIDSSVDRQGSTSVYLKFNKLMNTAIR